MRRYILAKASELRGLKEYKLFGLVDMDLELSAEETIGYLYGVIAVSLIFPIATFTEVVLV